MTNYGEHTDPGNDAVFTDPTADSDPTLLEANPESFKNYSYAVATEGKLDSSGNPRPPEQNEDRFYFNQQEGFFVLSDGAGGHDRGDLAADTVVAGFSDSLRRQGTDSIETSDSAVRKLETAAVDTQDRIKQIKVGPYDTAPLATAVAGKFF